MPHGFLYLRGVDRGPLVPPPGPPAVTLFALDEGPALARHDVAIADRTYNRLSLQVNADGPGRLEWRAAFPFWRAWVNGAEAIIERTAQGMKVVRVPAGRSEVVFRFRPAALRATVAIGYLAMAVAAASNPQSRTPNP